MSDEQDKELDDLLEEMGIEATKIADKPAPKKVVPDEIQDADYSEIESDEDEPVEEVDETKSTEENVLNKSKKKLTDKISGLYSHPDTREKFEKRLKTYDSAVEWTKNNGEIEAVEKIVPDVEKILFPHFVGGASVRAIWQQYGKSFNFSLATLYKARDFYMWEARKKAIGKSVMTEQGAEIVGRFSDYLTFFDDLMGEAMIRFKKNSEAGQNTNPFNQLKVQNIKDMKDLTELMMNLTGMKNGGKEDGRGSKSGVNTPGSNVGNKPKITDAKAARLLEILAEDDEEEEQ